MSKTLTIYFSAGGTTKRAAERLAGAIGSELYEIRPAVPYTRADLNWQDPRSRSSLEMNSPASRPEFIDDGFDVAPYERIFLGFPIWWYTAPRIVQSFLESRDFSARPSCSLQPRAEAAWGTRQKTSPRAAPARS